MNLRRKEDENDEVPHDVVSPEASNRPLVPYGADGGADEHVSGGDGHCGPSESTHLWLSS